ncbi:MAG: hypothetical protein LBS16_05085 [Prevotellaceae bacterium]|jgi:hypothetical protein|nr:hypothetical protein [Prevotellaceae bacterium]
MKSTYSFLIGLIGGLTVPLFFGWLYLTILYTGEMPLNELLGRLVKTSIAVKMLFMAIIPNLFAVFLLNHFEKWMACRGVFVAIIIYILAGIWIL